MQRSDAFERQVVESINLERARGRKCGKRPAVKAAPLTEAGRLERLARPFAAELLRTRNFSHTDAEGRDPSSRARSLGVDGFLGEALAKNARTPAQAIDALFRSESHCRVLTHPDARFVGVAFESADNSSFASYLVIETAIAPPTVAGAVP